MTETSDDFPAEGNPTRPTSATGLELQGEVAGLARLAEQGEAGRLACARRERGVAQAAAAARGGLEPGARADQVGQQPAVFVQDHGAIGDLDFQVRAEGAVAIVAHPLLAGRCGDVRTEMEVEQGVHRGVDDEDDAAAAATVTAVGTAQRLEFLAMDRGAAVTAGTRSRVDDDPIDKPRHRASPYFQPGDDAGPQCATIVGSHAATLSRWSARP